MACNPRNMQANKHACVCGNIRTIRTGVRAGMSPTFRMHGMYAHTYTPTHIPSCRHADRRTDMHSYVFGNMRMDWPLGGLSCIHAHKHACSMQHRESESATHECMQQSIQHTSNACMHAIMQSCMQSGQPRPYMAIHARPGPVIPGRAH